MKPRIGVITFPGTCDDRDALRAVDLLGGEGVALWHADSDLEGCTGVIIPGGFSYGDYLRAGAIAASRRSFAVRTFASAASGGPVLGICNGSAAGAAWRRVCCPASCEPQSTTGRFCLPRDVDLRVERAGSPLARRAAARRSPARAGQLAPRRATGSTRPPEEQERVEGAPARLRALRRRKARTARSPRRVRHERCGQRAAGSCRTLPGCGDAAHSGRLGGAATAGGSLLSLARARRRASRQRLTGATRPKQSASAPASGSRTSPRRGPGPGDERADAVSLARTVAERATA
jgi:hypothetical protein